ncbi:MAG TPA: hypothetical protein VHY37_06235 [Tepidisphaeraceae bacterium]|jgi:hypothetical protein|nr:hypothetical protein [Tepidisphaeraceae bacterium]
MLVTVSIAVAYIASNTVWAIWGINHARRRKEQQFLDLHSQWVEAWNRREAEWARRELAQRVYEAELN